MKRTEPDRHMLLSILMLFASFAATTLFSLLGAYFAGPGGAMAGMVVGIFLAFLLMARRAGR
jgi:hypothetical protein